MYNQNNVVWTPFPILLRAIFKKNYAGAWAYIVTIKQALFKTNKPTNIFF